MKSIFIIFSLFMMFMISFITNGSASTYNTFLLSEFRAYDRVPDMNDYGQVVFAEMPVGETHYEIYRYDTSTGLKTNISNNGFNNYKPFINNSGQIIWENGDLCFYEPMSNKITQVMDLTIGHPNYLNITDSGIATYSINKKLFQFDTQNYNTTGHLTYTPTGIIYDTTSDFETVYEDPNYILNDVIVNSSGKIVWQQYTDINFEVKYYDGNSVHNLSLDNLWDGSADINNNGDIVWIKNTGTELNLMHFDHSSSTIEEILSDFDITSWEPMINDNGKILFIGGSPSDTYDSNLYLTNGNEVSFLGSNVGQYDMTLNGNIVWSGQEGDDKEIFFYNSTTGEIIQITNNDYDDQAPKLNSNGDIVWWAQQSGLADLFAYDAITGEIFNVSNSSDIEEPLNFEINESGDIMWFFSGQRKIYFSDKIPPVPIPSAIWLFASGLVGLIGIGRRFQK